MAERITCLQIHANFFCSAGCFFCSVERDSPGRDMTLSEIIENIDYFAECHNIREVVLSGGEITERNDFPAIMGSLLKRDLDFVTIISNGHHFGTSRELVSCCKGVVDRVVVSLTPRNSKDLFSKDSFTGKTIHGIESLLRAKIEVQTNTVILRQNYNILADVAEVVLDLGIKSSIFTFPFPLGKTKKRMRQLVPTWFEIRSFLFKAIDLLEAGAMYPRIKNLPLCYLENYSRFCSRTTQRFCVTWEFQLDDHKLLPPFRLAFKKFKECSGCLYDSECDGFWNEYLGSGGFPNVQKIVPQ